jgi:hypothetical protein
MAALLVALWRMVGIYTSLREKGEAHADRVGVVSVLTEQLRDDLRRLPDIGPKPNQVSDSDPESEAIAAERDDDPSREPPPAEFAPAMVDSDREVDATGDPPPAPTTAWGPAWGNAPAKHRSGETTDRSLAPSHDIARTETDLGPAAEALPPARLYGDGTSLTLEHLDCETSRRGTHAHHGPSRTALRDDNLSGTGERSGGEADLEGEHAGVSVRLIRYWLAGAMPLVLDGEPSPSRRAHEEDLEGLDEALDDEEVAAGLYREEVVQARSSANLVYHRRDSGSPADEPHSDHAPPISEETFPQEEGAAELSRSSFRLPQVEWAKFRYYDGSDWQSSWDSRVDGRLPVAVEMNLWLESRLRGEGSSSTARRDDATTATVGIVGTDGQEAESWQTRSRARGDSTDYGPRPDAEDGGSSVAGGGDLELDVGEDGPMDRRPEVRQLVVLRSAASQASPPPGVDRRPFFAPPRRPPQLAPALP